MSNTTLHDSVLGEGAGEQGVVFKRKIGGFHDLKIKNINNQELII
jgi:hypothetical protein